MKTTKKVFITIGILTGLSLIFLVYLDLTETNKSQKAHVGKVKDMIVDGKLEGYNSLQGLELDSPLIVKGKKLSSENKLLWVDGIEGNGIPDGYTLSEFEITKVIKDETGRNLKENAHIQIAEAAFYNPQENANVHSNGYILMKKGKEYLLFLAKNESSDILKVRGTVFGKLPLEGNDLELIDKGDKVINYNSNTYEQDSLVLKVLNEAQDKYK